MKPFEAVFYKDDLNLFLEMLNNCGFQDAPNNGQFTMESRYRAAEFGDKFEDISFFITKDGSPSALVLAHKVGKDISFGGVGVKIISPESNLPNSKMSKIIIETLIERAREFNCQSISILDENSEKQLSDLGQQAFNYRAVPETKLNVLVSLGQDIEDIRKGIRKSYKPLISKGVREIEFKKLNFENIDRKAFKSFQTFHKKVSGRQTRPVESWDAQYEMIEKGCAELILGYMQEHDLVSSALFSDYGMTTSYAVAVYNRELFDKPLAHANVYEGILRAKARGMKFFNLGVIPAFGQASDKEYNIGNFKKGFCANLNNQIAWNLKLIN